MSASSIRATSKLQIGNICQLAGVLTVYSFGFILANRKWLLNPVTNHAKLEDMWCGLTNQTWWKSNPQFIDRNEKLNQIVCINLGNWRGFVWQINYSMCQVFLPEKIWPIQCVTTAYMSFPQGTNRKCVVQLLEKKIRAQKQIFFLFFIDSCSAYSALIMCCLHILYFPSYFKI